MAAPSGLCSQLTHSLALVLMDVQRKLPSNLCGLLQISPWVYLNLPFQNQLHPCRDREEKQPVKEEPLG